MSLPSISIIGAGALGSALGRAVAAQQYPIKCIYNRTESKAQQLAERVGSDSWGSFPTSPDELGSLVFLTVADSAIAEAAAQLATLDGDVSGQTYVHCSGSESAELLDPLREKGARVASFHPLQTFTSQSKPADFSGIYFSLQGDANAFAQLTDLAQSLGAQTLNVSAEEKSQLHGAAVFASNYLLSLLDAAVEVGSGGGLESQQVKQALLPLVQTSLQNASDQSFEDALSGPIKRGDINTVKRHLKLLDDRVELKALYCMLGLRTLKVAESAGGITGTDAEEMRIILDAGLDE